MKVFKKIISAALLMILCYPIWLYMSHVMNFMYAHFPEDGSGTAKNINDGFIMLIYGVAVLWTAVLSTILIFIHDEGSWLSHIRNVILRAFSIFIDAIIGSIPIWIGSLVCHGWGITIVILGIVVYIVCKIGFTAASLDSDLELDCDGNGFFWSIHSWICDLNDFSEEIAERKENLNNFVKTAKF